MWLFKRRPHLALRAPRGQSGTFIATLLVAAERELPVDAIEVELVGRDTSYHRPAPTHTFRRIKGHAQAPRLLRAGDYELRCSFDLPPDLPPTYSGRSFAIEYTLEARVVIPWWPDARDEWVVELGASPAAAALAQPSVTRAVVETPDGSPELEVSLPSSAFTLGGALTGALALSSIPARRHPSVHLTLVGCERSAEGGRAFTQSAVSMVVERPLEDGASVPFQLALPDNLVPSFHSAVGSINWSLEVTAAIGDAPDLQVTIPVALGGPAAAATPAAPPAMPLIGSAGLRAIWSSVAARCKLRYDDGRLHGDVHGIALDVHREARGTRRLLVGELRYRSLRLGLRVRGSERRFQSSAELDHHVQSRERAQSDALLLPLQAALSELPQASIDDERAHFQFDDGGHNLERLLAFARALIDLARALAFARQKLPAPQAMGGTAYLWRALAAQLGAELELGDLSINGHRQGVSFLISPEWPTLPGLLGPAALTILVRPSHHLGDAWLTRPVAITDANLPPHARQRLVQTAAPLRPLLPAVDHSVTTLAISRDELTCRLPMIPADPIPLEACLDALIDLAAQLRAGATPYR